VGANLDVMRQDTERMCTSAQGRLKPFGMTNLNPLAGLGEVVGFIESQGMRQKGAQSPGVA